MRRRRGRTDDKDIAPAESRLTQPPDALTILCSARISTLHVFHRLLALLIFMELVDRRLVSLLLYSNYSVGARGIPLLPSSLDDHAWRHVLILATIASIASFASVSRGLLPTLLLLTLYFSLSARAASFMWILDRYAQTLLVFSVLLPRASPRASPWIASGVVALARLQVCWIYLDAAVVKLRSGAWWRADSEELSALDVYLRHTTGSHVLRSMLAPFGEELALHALSSAALLLELAAPTMLLLSCACAPRARRGLARSALLLLASLHLGIALTMSGTMLLSAVAAAALVLWLDVAWPQPEPSSEGRSPRTWNDGARTMCLALLLGCGMLYEISRELAVPLRCSAELAQTLQVLLGNRWNVFGPAAPHVTWEIAPGRLADGSVVEVWRAAEQISWSVPAAGETLWHGRYRMFPFLGHDAAGEDEAAERFWEAVCREWDGRQPEAEQQARRLLRFKFFMLRAPLLRGGKFGAVGKTLVRAHTCAAGREEQE